MNRITYIGHATLQLDIAGQRLLTDPLLSRRVTHLWRAVPLPRSTPEALDAVLISHLHGDHLHLPSLRLLGKDLRLIVPRGAAPYLEINGFTHITEVSAGEVVDVNGLAIEATTAAHDGPSLPWRPDVPALGYIIHGPRPIYFAGDTDLFPEMATIGQTVDIALLPVWGYGPTLGPGHLDPWRAAKALHLLNPSTAIPIHWGTYFPAGLGGVLPHFLNHPPYQFARYARTLAPEVNTVILQPGEQLDLETDPSAERSPGVQLPSVPLLQRLPSGRRPGPPPNPL